MTKYQVPPGKNLHPEVDSSDWEARMARLVGLEEESQSPASSFEEDSGELRQPQAEPLEPREVATTQALSSNPFAKLALVGGGTLAVVVVAGLFLTQLMSGGSSRKSNTPNRTSLVPDTQAQVKLKPPQELQQEEIEALKTKLALSEQAQAVKDAQLALKTEKPTPIRTVPRSSYRTEPPYAARPRPTIIVQRIQPPPTFRDRSAIAQSVPPRVITVIRPVRVPQPVATRPQIRSAYVPPPLPSTVPTPATQATPTPTLDPVQEWARLSKLGSYGQVSSATTPQVNVSAEPRKPLITAQTTPTVQPTQPSVVRYTQTSSPKSLVVGSTAKAVLATAAFGESTRTVPGRYNNNNRNTNGGNFNRNKSNDNSDNDDKDNNIFIVQLKQPLKAVDGSIALPAQTQLLTKASFSDKGLAQFEVIKAVWQENGQRIEKNIPENTLTIRGPGSKPLIATEYKGSGGGSRFGSDLKVFALGGASKIGEVLNTPDSQVVSLPSTIKNSDGTINSTTTSAVLNQPRRNILAGILDGGGRSIVPEITRRETQDNARRSISPTSLWTLSKGKEVTVFVNQATSF
ncbi:MAG: hypothetical protein PUP93_05350 [Rhizonema sp. NSF051]|nr:hypothetical protein [Rhizonema sp. NSF051]